MAETPNLTATQILVFSLTFQQISPFTHRFGTRAGKPEDSKITMKIAQLANDGVLNLPILGVCLGHQALGLVGGYRLIKDPNGAVHGVRSLVR